MIPGWINGAGEETEQATPAMVVSSTKEEVQTTELDGIAAQATESQEIDSPQTENVRPTPRPALDATDPSTVTLGSGEIQLVEFFAYW
jgi:hypothetical protein